MLLVGDIGGTKIELAIFDPATGPRVPIAAAKFASAIYPDLVSVVRAYLAVNNRSIERACFAIAGPTLAGRATVTNLPWTLEEGDLARALGLKSVTLLNDLEATARAVPLLGPADLQTLSAGVPVSGGAIGVIAPGTGLGEAFLTWDGSCYHAHPSEGGHADFAPTTSRQIGLLQFMRGLFDHVSYEHVCSGIGLPHLYRYLQQTDAYVESPALARCLAESADPVRLIVAAALDSATPDPSCAATLELFAEILGAEAGNLALKVLATGGIYMAGGLAVPTLPELAGATFARAFRDKGRLSAVLSTVPIHIILAPAALIGAAAHGLALVDG